MCAAETPVEANGRPNYHEVEDGDDTLNWIAAQPWCSGRIGMVGGSLHVQWAAAASGNSAPETLISVVCGQRLCGSAPPGWVFHLGHAGLGLCGVSENLPP